MIGRELGMLGRAYALLGPAVDTPLVTRPFTAGTYNWDIDKWLAYKLVWLCKTNHYHKTLPERPRGMLIKVLAHV